MTEEEIRALVPAVEEGTFPHADWHHRQHLTVAAWYLVRHPEEEAIGRMRASIRKYNDRNGIKMTPEGGYHESMTVLFMRLAARVVRAHRGRPLPEVVEEVCRELGDMKGILRRYYTRDRILSWEARTTWVAPDVQPL